MADYDFDNLVPLEAPASEMRDIIGIDSQGRLTKYNVEELFKSLRGEKSYTVVDSVGDLNLRGRFDRSYDAPSIAAGGTHSFTITASGADMGDYVICSCSRDLQGMVMTAYVDSTGSVTVVLYNPTAGAIDLATASFKVIVFPVDWHTTSLSGTTKTLGFTDGILTSEA